MVALEGRWEEKKESATKWYIYIPKRVVEVFLSFSFLVLDFWFWFFTVALLAWRVVFFWGWALGWGWVGVGVHYTIRGKVLPSTGLQVHVTFFFY